MLKFSLAFKLDICVFLPNQPTHAGRSKSGQNPSNQMSAGALLLRGAVWSDVEFGEPENHRLGQICRVGQLGSSSLSIDTSATRPLLSWLAANKGGNLRPDCILLLGAELDVGPRSPAVVRRSLCEDRGCWVADFEENREIGVV